MGVVGARVSMGKIEVGRKIILHDLCDTCISLEKQIFICSKMGKLFTAQFEKGLSLEYTAINLLPNS